jgi:P pilus assembly chaperone PapD
MHLKSPENKDAAKSNQLQIALKTRIKGFLSPRIPSWFGG